MTAFVRPRRFFTVENFSFCLLLLFYSTLLLVAQRNFYFVIPTLFAVMGLGFFTYLCRHGVKIKISKEQLTVLYFFTFYALISALVAVYHNEGINTVKYELIPLVLLPAFLFFSYFCTDERLFSVIFPGSAAAVGLFAVYDKFGRGTDRALELQQPVIPAAGVLMVMALFSFAFAFNYIKRKPLYAALAFAAGILGVTGCILTGSRGTWLCLPIVFIALFIFYRQNFPRLIKVYFLPLVLVVFIGALFYFNTGIILRLQQVKMDLTWYFADHNPNSSIGIRFELWKGAVAGIMQKPWLGWGTDGYVRLKSSQIAAGFIIPETREFVHAHNQFLDVLVKKGIIQFAATLFIIFVPLQIFCRHFKNNNLIAVLGFITLFAVATFCLSDSFLRTPLGMIFYIMTIYLLLGFLLKSKYEP